MSRHPVTPMHEADLKLHLAKQTALATVLASGQWPAAGIGLLDVHDEATQQQAGERLLDWPGGFVVGSSGVEYALIAALVQRREILGRRTFEPLGPVPQTVVVSGSVSPTTERQIRHALLQGFRAVPVDAVALARNLADVRRRAVGAALDILSDGLSPLIHTALGPSSDVGPRLGSIPDSRKHVGQGLGAILKVVLESSGLRRAIIAGGDSSSHALGQMDIFALTTRMPLPATPGSPLCTACAGSAVLDGIEIALKGGQVGGDDYFVRVRDGRP
jgi:uncharacterized protein YgbK (DUF1537 family)